MHIDLLFVKLPKYFCHKTDEIMKPLVYLAFGVALAFATSCTTKVEQSINYQAVKVDTVRSESGSVPIQFPGKVRAAQDISLSFRVGGAIQKIYVQDGQHVRSGELLVALDPTDYQVQLDATEAEYNQIKAEVDRVTALYEEGVTTPNDYDKATYGLKQITAKYEHHKDELSYTKLYAPFDGYVQKHMFEANEIISAGTPVISMVSNTAAEVEINLPAVEYIRKEQFSDYYCTFDFFEGKKYKLTPISITPKANANQLYTMKLRLDSNASPQPSPGMNTMVTILYSESKSSSVIVPTAAIISSDNGNRSSVFVYDDATQTIQLTDVEVLRPLSDGTSLVTSEQLKVGDIVVSSGVHHVSDGEIVKPLNATSQTNVGGLL